MKKFMIYTALTCSALCYGFAQAKEPPRSLATDPRVKIVSFQKNNVVPIRAQVFQNLQIMFGQDEVIEGIKNGDIDAWQSDFVKGVPNMVFIKPTIIGSNTNMTIVTNKHTYYFHVMSEKHDPSMKRSFYALQFRYPEEEHKKLIEKIRYNEREKRTIMNAKRYPKRYNWNYSFSGARDIMPLHVFDDGRFTYLQLRHGLPVPAVFSVDNREGKESVVNYRREGDYLVIQELAPQFTLRSGKYHVASVFNNRLIHRLESRG